MNKSFLAGIGLCLFLTSPLYSQPHPFGDSDNIPLMSSRNSQGATIEYTASAKLVARLPEWSPENGNPPNLAVALAKAKAWGKVHFSKFDSVSIRSIEIARIGIQKPNNRWYYQIQLQPEMN